MNKEEKIQYLFNQVGNDEKKRRALLEQVEKNGLPDETYPDDALHPVDAALKEALKNVPSLYHDFAVSYLRFFMKEAGAVFVSALALQPTPASKDYPKGKFHIVSQAIFGDLNLVAGLYAEDDVFLELARRYAGENFAEIDEMAIDSMQEFLNVIHGGYSVELGKAGHETDLDIPRWSDKVSPQADSLVQVAVYTSFGPFHVVLAEEEFIPSY